MPLSAIQPDWEVFAQDGKPGIGAVRQVGPKHLDIYIEGFGDTRVTADQVTNAHDGKVLLDLDSLPSDLQQAIRHAHDGERR